MKSAEEWEEKRRRKRLGVVEQKQLLADFAVEEKRSERAEAECARLKEAILELAESKLQEIVSRYTQATIHLLALIDGIKSKDGDETDRVFASYEFDELREVFFFASGAVPTKLAKGGK